MFNRYFVFFHKKLSINWQFSIATRKTKGISHPRRQNMGITNHKHGKTLTVPYAKDDYSMASLMNVSGTFYGTTCYIPWIPISTNFNKYMPSMTASSSHIWQQAKFQIVLPREIQHYQLAELCSQYLHESSWTCNMYPHVNHQCWPVAGLVIMITCPESSKQNRW